MDVAGRPKAAQRLVVGPYVSYWVFRDLRWMTEAKDWNRIIRCHLV